jgi:hypothetical protein
MENILVELQNPQVNFGASDGTNIAMQMKPMLPQDQISLISNNSSVMKSVSKKEATT